MYIKKNFIGLKLNDPGGKQRTPHFKSKGTRFSMFSMALCKDIGQCHVRRE